MGSPFQEWRLVSSYTFGLTQKYQKVKAGQFPKRSLRLRGTNPRPRLDGYQIMNISLPAWLWIRNAPAPPYEPGIEGRTGLFQSWAAFVSSINLFYDSKTDDLIAISEI